MEKAYRVKKSQDFSEIIKHRQSAANKDFVVYYLENQTHLHVGISVSKKLGKATLRNKIKRQVREMMKSVDKSTCVDYIIIVRNHYLMQSYEDNKKSLYLLIKKINKRMGR